MNSMIIGVLVGLVTTSVVADTQLLATDSASSKSGCSECEKCGTIWIVSNLLVFLEKLDIFYSSVGLKALLQIIFLDIL